MIKATLFIGTDSKCTLSRLNDDEERVSEGELLILTDYHFVTEYCSEVFEEQHLQKVIESICSIQREYNETRLVFFVKQDTDIQLIVGFVWLLEQKCITFTKIDLLDATQHQIDTFRNNRKAFSYRSLELQQRVIRGMFNLPAEYTFGGN